MKSLITLYNYLIYRFRSVNEHGIHSPFIFELTRDIIYNNAQFYCYEEIEKLRSGLLDSEEGILILDMGAGSKKNRSNNRKIREIAKNSAKPPKYAQLLFRLANHFQPKTILELGTSLGLSTSYLASANKYAHVTSIEGSPEIAAIAKKNFEHLQLENIDLKTGNFDNELPLYLKHTPVLDMVFFDGNHQKIPTLSYFEQCLSKANENSIFIFDDIYWSDEMKSAWEEIKKNEKVTVTVDLFFLGIVFFRKEQAKQHFIVRF